LTVVQPDKLKKPEVVSELADYHPEAIVVAAYGQILPRAVLEIPEFGCLNLHPSLLPRHRGASPVTATILAGDEFAGVSIMLMDAGLDTGPVFTRAQIPVNGRDTTGTLTEKLSLIASHLVQDVILHWVRGELKPQPQDEAAVTYSSPVTKEEGEINWGLSAVEVWRRVRAFQPWPGAFTMWRGKRLEVLQGFPLPWAKGLEVGTVVDLRPVTAKAAFGITTADGILGVCNVQLAGKKAMSAVEFIRGQSNIIGARLPSN
jgi:methionyl-tRNA formyltransferase